MGGIRLHPEHGLNPSLNVCQFCGRDTGEILLFGVNWPDRRGAPHRMCADPWPCEKCEAEWAAYNGVVVLEAKAGPEGNPIPTGRMVVIKQEAARRIFTDEMAEETINKGKALMMPDVFEAIFGEQLKTAST